MAWKETLFDRLAERYDSWFDSQGKLIFQIELAALRAIIGLLPEPWLEVGVGSGRFAQALRIKYGIDPSQKLLQIAENRGINVIKAVGENLPFADNSFGTVFILITLCFVNDPSQVLSETHRVLTHNGQLVIGLIPADSPWGRFYRQKAEQGHPFYSHAKFYTVKEIEAMLNLSRFRLEQYISTLYQKPELVTTLEPPTEGYSLDAGFVVFLAQKT